MANHPSNRVETEEQLEAIFTFHPPKDEKTKERYRQIRMYGLHLARAILGECPGCADRTAAIRKVREAVMTANAAIALEPEVDDA